MTGWKKKWLIECSANVLFSLAYFILLGRTQSAEFSLNILELSALVAFIYVVAIFVSSYHFDADLFPFYSLLRAFFEKSLAPLWLNIPAQLTGTVLGLLVYTSIHDTLLTLSPLANVSTLTVFEISDIPMRSLIMAVLVFILVYSMIIVRKLFLLSGMTGTFIIAILVFVLSAITIPIQQISIVTWWQDTVLNFYHYLNTAGSGIQIGLSDFVTGIVLMAVIYLAKVKAFQYVRPKSDHHESDEPGEYTPQFSKDYDI